MRKKKLLEELAQEISDRNHAYNQSLEIIQVVKPVRPRRKYPIYALVFTLAFITAMYGVSVTERSELQHQVSEYRDLTKRPLPDLQPVKFSKFTVINPTNGCNGLFRHVGDGVECVGI